MQTDTTTVYFKNINLQFCKWIIIDVSIAFRHFCQLNGWPMNHCLMEYRQFKVMCKSKLILSFLLSLNLSIDLELELDIYILR